MIFFQRAESERVVGLRSKRDCTEISRFTKGPTLPLSHFLEFADSDDPLWSPHPHGCQMAMARFLDCMPLVLRLERLWLRYAALQNLIPSFPWIAPPRPPPWRNPRKGRDQILPSGNHGESHMTTNDQCLTIAASRWASIMRARRIVGRLSFGLQMGSSWSDDSFNSVLVVKRITETPTVRLETLQLSWKPRTF